MDSWEVPVHSWDTLSTKTPEAQWNLKMCLATLKKEKVECIDDEESPCSEEMYPSEPLDSSQYENHYDSKGFVVEKLKKEFPEDEHPQSDFSINYTIDHENKELLKLIDKQEVNHENTEEGLSLIIKEENDNKNNQFIVKREKIDEQDTFNSAGATSIHYDVLMTPHEVQCKLCGRIFKNSFNLLRHNNEHIKVEMNTPGYNSKATELHQCQYCDNFCNNHDNMLAHAGDVHSEEIPEDKLCGEHFESAPSLKRRVVVLQKQMFPNQVPGDSVKCIYSNAEYKDTLYKHMQLCLTGKKDEEMKYKCDSCKRVFKSEHNLTAHIKRVHYDYGRTFTCWCGKQFRTPTYLYMHMKRQHDNMQLQCNYCQKTFNSKCYLLKHIKNMHYDYGEVFECRCGKQFRTPRLLYLHKRRQHDRNINEKKNYTLNNHRKPFRTGKEGEEMKYKCDSCAGVYKSKPSLTMHIKRMHYDYGRTFECRCGKQFRTPTHLRLHMRMQHNDNLNVQCDYCQKFYKSKYRLVRHIKMIHHDYGKVFACWCGKQFRTPINLRVHVRMQHDGVINDTDNDKLNGSNNHMKLNRTGKDGEEMKYKCDSCERVYKSKMILTTHIKRTHIGYGSMFVCWCGKQFRTPIYLNAHMKRQHNGKMKFQCDHCQKKFNSKSYLVKHIKNIHYDYGKVFECLCGKQFRTPIRLYLHKRRKHNGNINDINNDKLHRSNNHMKLSRIGKEGEEMKYKCDLCERVYKSKHSLTMHLKRIHYNHGRTFACWCGKRFRTPTHLRKHTSLLHNGEMRVQCDYCQKFYKTKTYLGEHIKMVHYDYGKVFECQCGKLFRTPIHLRVHMRLRHDGKMEDRNS